VRLVSGNGTRACPFCAETIKVAARGCRLCGTIFVTEENAGTRNLATAASPVSPPVITEAEIAELLTSLVEKSLVIYEEDERGGGRYRFLETVRQYSRDRLLRSGEGEALRNRHRDWFLRQTMPGQGWESTPPEQDAYFTFTNSEYDNLRQALEWSLHGSNGGEEGLCLAAALSLHWFETGTFTEARRWLEEALVQAPDAPAPVRARVLTWLGMIVVTDDPVARRSLEESVALSRETGDERQLVGALLPLSYRCAREGDRARGKAFLDEAVALSHNLGASFAVYCDLHSGLHAQLVGEYPAAERFLERVVTHPSAWKSVRHYTLASLGEVRLDLGKFPLARMSFCEGLVEASRLRATMTILRCLRGLACARLAEHGDATRAARLLGAAAAHGERLGAVMLPTDATVTERAVAAARLALEEPAYHAAFAQGRAMSLEQVVEEALDLCVACVPGEALLPPLAAGEPGRHPSVAAENSGYTRSERAPS
jgi:hypothetical protein